MKHQRVKLSGPNLKRRKPCEAGKEKVKLPIDTGWQKFLRNMRAAAGIAIPLMCIPWGREAPGHEYVSALLPYLWVPIFVIIVAFFLGDHSETYLEVDRREKTLYKCFRAFGHTMVRRVAQARSIGAIGVRGLFIRGYEGDPDTWKYQLVLVKRSARIIPLSTSDFSSNPLVRHAQLLAALLERPCFVTQPEMCLKAKKPLWGELELWEVPPSSLVAGILAAIIIAILIFLALVALAANR